MPDEADRAQPYIDDVITEGRARAKQAGETRSLRPVVLDMNGERFGVCHYCAEPIRPGNLFCEMDREDPEHSCSLMWEHERQRREVNGR